MADQETEPVYRLTRAQMNVLLLYGYGCETPPSQEDLDYWLETHAIAPQPAPDDAVTEAAVQATFSDGPMSTCSACGHLAVLHSLDGGCGSACPCNARLVQS